MAEQTIKFAPRNVSVERRADGSLLLRSPLDLGACEWRITDFLPIWADRVPERTFLAQRSASGEWERLNYADAWSKVQLIGENLLSLGACRGDRMAILSGNSIENALISFAAMSIGIVIAPISPNYTLMPGGLERLKDIAGQLRPRFVFVQNGRTFGAGRALSDLAESIWIGVEDAEDMVSFRTLEMPVAIDGFRRARTDVGLDDVAKILFTSGSTGLPKGVLNTHRMMATSLQMGSRLVPPSDAPVQVEWLPWHHTMGSNVILHGILKNGGSLYIDEGRPLPTLFSKTIENLREISPTAMFNVPAGYNLLCDAIEKDKALGEAILQRVDRISYAGAAISEATLTRLYALSWDVTGRKIPVMSGYGTTETAPTIATTHWATERSGEIGLPAPGLELKLIPVSDTYEARVKGPNVTPGYLGREDLTRDAFDDEGFYRIGDTVSFIDPERPELGLRFTGRVSENFKLANGTWVPVGQMRAAVLAATGGLLLDVVVAGENRGSCALLAWLNPTEAARLTDAPAGELASVPAVVAALRDRLAAYNSKVGSSERVDAISILREPPSLAAGEITDKAYVNQRAVLKHRSALVERLYEDGQQQDVIRLGEAAERRTAAQKSELAD